MKKHTRPGLAIASGMAILVLIALLPVPVSAADYTLTNNFFLFRNITTSDLYGVSSVDHDARLTDQRISLVEFHIQKNSRIDFTIYYGTDSTVSGYFEGYPSEDPLRPGFFYTNETYSLGSDTKSYTFWDSEYEDIALSGYAKSNEETPQTGFIAYSREYGSLDNDLAVFYPVSNISRNTIYRITATSSKPFDITITDGTPSEVAGNADKSILDIAWEWINFGIALSGQVFEAVKGILGFIKFFFIDNLVLIIALWIVVPMAYCAMKCRGDVFRFYKQFFGLQKKMVEFIIWIWNSLISIISQFRSIFRL